MTHKAEPWATGENVPHVEVEGPFANQYRIFIDDDDGDWIALMPLQAKRLIERLQAALDHVRQQREEAKRGPYGKRKTA